MFFFVYSLFSAIFMIIFYNKRNLFVHQDQSFVFQLIYAHGHE